jgi:hypothetical protein
MRLFLDSLSLKQSRQPLPYGRSASSKVLQIVVFTTTLLAGLHGGVQAIPVSVHNWTAAISYVHRYAIILKACFKS